MVDLVAVLVDYALDAFAARSGIGTRVCYRAAEPDVVANELFASRIFERVFDVRLLHPKVTVHIPSVVRLVPLRHVLPLRLLD
jgi:hypothetical protein